MCWESTVVVSALSICELVVGGWVGGWFGGVGEQTK